MNLRQIISLCSLPTVYVVYILLLEYVDKGLAQNPDPLFELPVQLIGFPVIVLSVRLSQFAKKLAYSLSPIYAGKRITAAVVDNAKLLRNSLYVMRTRNLGQGELAYESTYRSRNKRDTAMLAYNADIAQKEILREFGPRACVLAEPCRVHASRPGHYTNNTRPNWPQVFSNYKVQSTGTKQWYLLSVFIGDAVRDVPLCRLLAKRMPCPNVGPLPPPQPHDNSTDDSDCTMN
uniref:Uncharacterized protein n=1 Tax=Glossina austeni TaxID=7395 RepID=A0A1A9V445_GLOAU